MEYCNGALLLRARVIENLHDKELQFRTKQGEMSSREPLVGATATDRENFQQKIFVVSPKTSCPELQYFIVRIFNHAH